MDFYEEWRGDTLFRIYPCNKNNDNKTEVKTMDKNKAPKEIEGTYLVAIKGNKVSVVRSHADVEAYADHKTYRCHPDDKFDLMECIKMYNTPEPIKAGDMVNIVNCYKCYDTASGVLVTIAN